MKLNTIKPAAGSKTKAKRLGRGIGSGLGKTSGKGHKGQKARSGGFHRRGFEGGQTPLQRRLPKFGFTSRLSLVTSEIRLDALHKVEGGVIDFQALMDANLITKQIKRAKIIAAGKLTSAVTIKNVPVTKGAREAIIAAGGKVE
jgi:large subunit ribosomal protein L15